MQAFESWFTSFDKWVLAVELIRKVCPYPLSRGDAAYLPRIPVYGCFDTTSQIVSLTTLARSGVISR